MQKKILSFLINNLRKKINLENSKVKNQIILKSKNKYFVDPITKYDLKIEKIIRKEIVKKFPDHAISGEEVGDKKGNSNYKWIIDPIDGTKALLIGQPTWSNLIGILNNSKPIYSFANFPILKKYYYSDDKNTFLVFKKKKKRIKTSKVTVLRRAKIVTNSIHTLCNKKIYNIFKDYKYFFKISGCDAYNYCLLAEGKIDIIIEAGLKQHDILPLIGIIKKAGGNITNWSGGEDIKNGSIIVSSNFKLHKRFLSLIKNF